MVRSELEQKKEDSGQGSSPAFWHRDPSYPTKQFPRLKQMIAAKRRKRASTSLLRNSRISFCRYPARDFEGLSPVRIPTPRRAPARRRPATGSDVPLRIAGAASAAGSSPAADPREGGRHPAREVAAVGPLGFGGGAAVDCAGAAAAGLAVADFLLGAERAAAEGAVEVQPAVRLVGGEAE